MRTQEFIQVLEDLIAHNRLELVISVLRKFLKPLDRDLYRQVIQLSANFLNQHSMGVSGTLSPEASARQRNYTVHALLFLLEQMDQQLPPMLTGEAGDLARSLLSALEFARQEDPGPVQEAEELLSPSPSYTPRMRAGMTINRQLWRPLRQHGGMMLTFSGWILFLLSLILNFGQADPYEEVRKQQVFELASAYGLTHIDGINAHLSFGEKEFDYWHRKIQEGLSLQELEHTFVTMAQVLKRAEKEKREILTHSDLELLASIEQEKQQDSLTVKPGKR